MSSLGPIKLTPANSEKVKAALALGQTVKITKGPANEYYTLTIVPSSLPSFPAVPTHAVVIPENDLLKMIGKKLSGKSFKDQISFLKNYLDRLASNSMIFTLTDQTYLVSKSKQLDMITEGTYGLQTFVEGLPAYFNDVLGKPVGTYLIFKTTLESMSGGRKRPSKKQQTSKKQRKQKRGTRKI